MTGKENQQITETSQMSFSLAVNTSKLKIISKKHLKSRKKSRITMVKPHLPRTVFSSLGEYDKTKEYFEGALVIMKDIGDKSGETSCHANLGIVSRSGGNYAIAKEYHHKALRISKEIGHRKGEGACYGNLGTVFSSIGDFDKAKEYHEKALVIAKEMSDSERIAVGYANLGNVFISFGEHCKASEHLEKAVAISRKIGIVEKQSVFLGSLAWLKYLEGKIKEAFPYLFSSIEKCEKLRGFLEANDQFKINFAEDHVFPYWTLSQLFCVSENYYEAL